MEFKDRLKDWIKENNIKQADIAKKANVNKSFISNLVSGRVNPSEHIINILSEMSGHSVHWWLFGKEDYENLNALSDLINFLIEKDYIDKETGSYNENTQKILLNMLDTEIKDRIKDMKKAQD